MLRDGQNRVGSRLPSVPWRKIQCKFYHQKMSDETLNSMLDVNENKPRRRRIVRGGDALLATSNETKMKEKAKVVEKKAIPLFNTVKPAVAEKINEVSEKIFDPTEVIQFANPLPLSEKPRQKRGRKPKAAVAPEPAPVPETVAPAPAAEPETVPDPPKKTPRPALGLELFALLGEEVVACGEEPFPNHLGLFLRHCANLLPILLQLHEEV